MQPSNKGFAPKSKKGRGGKIVGPGTGTSDDIQKQVPEGSYIMPADSTAQIGEQALDNMGAPAGDQVDVRLSNGEYEIPPEQVHAIGVQALDQVRAQTHSQAPAQGATGFQPNVANPNSDMAELPKFAIGGLVGQSDDDRQKSLAAATQNAQRPASQEATIAEPTIGQRFYNPFESVGPYWSEKNAEFEATNPSFTDRVVRGINPLTSMGSAFGAMHDAASEGNVRDIGIAAAQSIPAFGVTRAVTGPLIKGLASAPSLGRTAAALTAGATAGAAADEAQARGFKNGGLVTEEEIRKRKAPTAQDVYRDSFVTQAVNRATGAQQPAPAVQQPAQQQAQQSTAPSGNGAAGLYGLDKGFKGNLYGTNTKFPQQQADAMKRAATPAYRGGMPDVPRVDNIYANANPFGAIVDAYNEANVPTSSLPRMAGAARSASEDVAKSWQDGNYGHAIGQALRGIGGTFVGLADDVYQDAILPFAKGGGNMLRGLVGMEIDAGQSDGTGEVGETGAASAAQAAQDAPAGANPANAAPERYASGILKPQMVNGIPTFTNENAKGFDPNSVNTISSQAMMALNPSTVNRLNAARSAAVARGEPLTGASGFQPGQGGGGITIVGSDSRLDEDRRRAMAAASTPHRGAQGGQLTSAQLNAMRGLIGDEQSNASKVARNATDAARLNLEQRRQAFDEATKVGDVENAQFRSGLMQQYREALTTGDTEAAQSIAATLQALNRAGGTGTGGDNLKNNFMTVNAPNVWDENTGTWQPGGQQLVDLRTQRPVGFNAQQQQWPLPSEYNVRALKKSGSQKDRALFDSQFGPGAADRYLK